MGLVEISVAVTLFTAVVASLGVVILPPNPGFYHGVSSVGELVDFVVARILDRLGIDNDLSPRWGSDDGE